MRVCVYKLACERTINVDKSPYHHLSQAKIVSSMKGDVKRQSFTDYRRRRASLDIQSLTSGAGSENCVSAESFHLFRVQRSSILTLRKPRIGESANHGSIGDSRPTAFFGYARGHSVVNETACRSILCLSHYLILTLEPKRFTDRPTPERCFRCCLIAVAALRPLANSVS